MNICSLILRGNCPVDRKNAYCKQRNTALSVQCLHYYIEGRLYSVDWTVAMGYGTGLRESSAHHFMMTPN